MHTHHASIRVSGEWRGEGYRVGGHGLKQGVCVCSEAGELGRRQLLLHAASCSLSGARVAVGRRAIASRPAPARPASSPLHHHHLPPRSAPALRPPSCTLPHLLHAPPPPHLAPTTRAAQPAPTHAFCRCGARSSLPRSPPHHSSCRWRRTARSAARDKGARGGWGGADKGEKETDGQREGKGGLLEAAVRPLKASTDKLKRVSQRRQRVGLPHASLSNCCRPLIPRSSTQNGGRE